MFPVCLLQPENCSEHDTPHFEVLGLHLTKSNRQEGKKNQTIGKHERRSFCWMALRIGLSQKLHGSHAKFLEYYNVGGEHLITTAAFRVLYRKNKVGCFYLVRYVNHASSVVAVAGTHGANNDCGSCFYSFEAWRGVPHLAADILPFCLSLCSFSLPGQSWSTDTISKRSYAAKAIHSAHCCVSVLLPRTKVPYCIFDMHLIHSLPEPRPFIESCVCGAPEWA